MKRKEEGSKKTVPMGYGFVASLEISRNNLFPPKRNTFSSKQNSAATSARRNTVDGAYYVHHSHWGAKAKMAAGEKG